MNRKHINDILAVIPVASTFFGYPRKKAVMKDYIMGSSSDIILEHDLDVGRDSINENFTNFLKPISRVDNVEFFTAVLRNARVWGRNGAVISHKDFFISDVSREFNADTKYQHSVFYTIKQKRAAVIMGDVAVIGTAGANIYYHWMLDVLPRIGLLQQNASLDSFCYFITEFAGLDFQKESLEMLGINSQRILPSNNNWNFHVKAERLWVPSLAGVLDQPNAFQVNFIRSLFQCLISKEKPFRKIYISREKTSRRMIQNEMDIWPSLEEAGFEMIHCETLSLVEQVKLFSEAAIIVGSHGSAFTNLVFCQPGTKVLEIFNKSHVNACFWFVAGLLNLHYNFLQGTSVHIDKNPKNDNTWIDPIAVKGAVIALENS